jgi:hypothetical protein
VHGPNTSREMALTSGDRLHWNADDLGWYFVRASGGRLSSQRTLARVPILYFRSAERAKVTFPAY